MNTHPITVEIKYYKQLDGLRGVAALMVMLFHFFPSADRATQPILYTIRKLAIFGQTGVTLFFVLSGFLITRILLQAKPQQNYFGNFYIKRALRIFPLYYLGLLIFYFILPLITGFYTGADNSWAYWLYLQNITDTFLISASGPQHYWSLAVEEHFYLFWPLLIYYVPNKYLPRLIGTVVVGALLCRCLLIYFNYGTFYFTFSIMDGLAIGAFLAWYELNTQAISLNFNYIMLAGLVLLIPTWLFTGGNGYHWLQIIKFPIIACFYMGLIGHLVWGGGWLKALMQKPFFRFTGKISYGLYVFHPFCYMLFRHFWPGQNIWLDLTCCFGLSYLVATASFYLFEKRFLDLKKRFELPQWKQEEGAQFN